MQEWPIYFSRPLTWVVMVDINICPFHLRDDKVYKSLTARYYTNPPAAGQS